MISEFGFAGTAAILIGLMGWTAIGATYFGYFTPLRGLLIAILLWVLSAVGFFLKKKI